MPNRSSSDRGPMPDSFSSCGVLNAPPARITSRRAVTWTGAAAGPGSGLRVRPGGVRLGQVLDATGRRALSSDRGVLEQDAGDQSTGADLQPVRPPPRDVQDALPAAVAVALPYGDRDQPEPLGLGARPPVVGGDGRVAT